MSTLNLATVGRAGWCLGYVSDVLGIRSGQYRSAWHAWLGTRHKYGRNDPLPNVPVLLWFEHWGAYDDGNGPYDGRPVGAVGNWGHVVLWVPANGLFYSSPTGPIGTTGHSTFKTISAVEATFNATYVGWSEDLAGVRFVQPTEEDMTPEQAAQLDQTFKRLRNMEAAAIVRDKRLVNMEGALIKTLAGVAKITSAGNSTEAAQIAAEVEKSLKDDFAAIPKAVNDDAAERLKN